MSDRIPCCVPFCRRTFSRAAHPNASWVMCGEHWRGAPKAMRRAYGLMVRRYKQMPTTNGKLLWRKYRQLERMSERIKAAAIAAAGAQP